MFSTILREEKLSLARYPVLSYSSVARISVQYLNSTCGLLQIELNLCDVALSFVKIKYQEAWMLNGKVSMSPSSDIS